MDTFVIEGGRRLEGRLRVQGSKNAALPLLAAALMTSKPVTLHDVPDLADIRNMLRLLGELGAPVESGGPTGALLSGLASGVAGSVTGGAGVDVPAVEPTRPAWDRSLTLRVIDESVSHARYDVVRTMRASICVLGPLVAKRGFARVSMPGGCAIGDRPVDLHLRGLAALGAEITLDGGDIIARAPRDGLRGATIFLGGPNGSTVLGTANVMCAAALARGTTVIESAACEPEIVDLANLLNRMGARVSGHGSPRVRIDGVGELGGAEHTVIPDRIEAGTLMCAAAITNGDLTLENCPMDALMAALDRLSFIGVQARPIDASTDQMRRTVRITTDRVLRPVEITTQPHPGFPTDLQAQFMALLTLAEGNSVITERIFPERFLHVAELSRMGARMSRQGATVVISGVRKLVGAPVMASDLRASAGLVLAGLAAEGRTIVNRVYHLDRGYERLDDRLRTLGASIDRVDDRVLKPGEE